MRGTYAVRTILHYPAKILPPNLFQDLHMVNLEEFKYGGTNVTAFRLLDPERDEVRQVVSDWMHGELRYGSRNFHDKQGQNIKVPLKLWIHISVTECDAKL